jgi:hypothetical protein
MRKVKTNPKEVFFCLSVVALVVTFTLGIFVGDYIGTKNTTQAISNSDQVLDTVIEWAFFREVTIQTRMKNTKESREVAERKITELFDVNRVKFRQQVREELKKQKEAK